MTKGRDIAAESISGLLDVARAQQRSGLLRAEYSQGNRLEEGELYILAGQPIYARTGNLLGQEALNYLLSWRNIYFSFAADVPRPPANITSAFNTGRVTTSLQAPTQAPARFPSTGGLRWNIVEERGDFAAPTNSLPGMEQMVPQKLGPEQNILSLPLTRRQRFIYFLVDGRRSVADLARCASKPVAEIEQILSELQEQGLVAI